MGRWRTRVVWRLYGWAILQFAIQFGWGRDPGTYLAEHPWSWHLLTVAGIALLGLGPRLPLLGAAAIAATSLLGQTTRGDLVGTRLMLDEYALYAGLPALSLLFSLPHARAPDRDVVIDRATVAVFRVAAVTSLGAAAFHKLNVDFLDPAVSWVGLSKILARNWGVPVGELSPAAFLVLEAIAAVVVLGYPRAGILLAVVVTAGLAHVGPTAFVAMIIATLAAFWRHDDGPRIAAGLHKHALAIGVALAAAIALSAWRFRGDLYAPYASFELGAGLVLAATVFAIPRLELRPSKPWAGIGRARGPLAVTLVVALLNAASPYLGLKYRYSFAMLSNLRVDELRWNSLLVPRAVAVFDRAPYVHITRVDGPRPARDDPELGHWLLRGSYTPDELLRRIAYIEGRGVSLAVTLDHQGQTRTTPDIAADLRLRRWLGTLPPARLFQKYAGLRAPQACMH